MTNYKWLNKDSRKFLERGYLEEGEMPEQRIEDIGNKDPDTLNAPASMALEAAFLLARTSMAAFSGSWIRIRPKPKPRTLIVIKTASSTLSSRLSNGRPKTTTAKYRMCRMMGAITIPVSSNRKTTLNTFTRTHSCT